MFDLPDRLAAKADPALVADDERHFAAIADALSQSIAHASERLDAVRRAPVRLGQEAVDRDLETRRLGARLHALRRFGLDLCLGRMVGADDPEPVYVETEWAEVRRSLLEDRALRTTFDRAWPLLDPPASSQTCGRCPPTCGRAHPGSTPQRSGRCSARTRVPGRCPTCRSWRA